MKKTDGVCYNLLIFSSSFKNLPRQIKLSRHVGLDTDLSLLNKQAMTCKSIIVKMRCIFTAANLGIFGGYLFLAMIRYKGLHQESTLKSNAK